MKQFRIIPSQPLYCFVGYNKSWYRILMLENGYYLRLQITPLNPTVQSEWEDMLRDKRYLIHWANSSLDWSKNHFTRKLPAEIVCDVHCHLGHYHAERLLTGDLWSEIEPLWPTDYDSSYDVSDWLGRCGYNGGIPLEKIQKNPPTWAEKHEVDDKRRQEERKARIATALGNQEPFNEVELALGRSLEQHDWSYEFSDCGATWQSGQKHKDELECELKALPKERARLVWKAFVHQYNEEYWRCPV